MVGTDTIPMEFSFLTSGPKLRLSIPSELSSIPELSSPVLSGQGAREFVFEPDPRGQRLSEGLARDGELLDVLSDRDGRPVELYRRQYLPLTWWLRWPLDGGTLATHVREEDGFSRIRTAIDNVSIVETSGGPPFLLLFSPLRRIVSSFPGYQEFATTWTDEADLSLRFVRPAFISPGDTVSDSGPQSSLRAGTSFGMEVQVSSTDMHTTESVLSLVMASLGT